MRRVLRRRTAGRVMLGLAAAMVMNSLVLLVWGEGLTALEMLAVILIAAGWVHAGLVSPGMESPPRSGLIVLGTTSVMLASYTLPPGFALMVVVLTTYGVVGLGWGE